MDPKNIIFNFNFGRSTPPMGNVWPEKTNFQVFSENPKWAAPSPKHFLQCFHYFPTSCYSEVHIEVLQKPRSQSIGFHSPARGVDNPRPFLNNHRPVVTWICKSYIFIFQSCFMYIVAILSKASENKTNETEVVD